MAKKGRRLKAGYFFWLFDMRGDVMAVLHEGLLKKIFSVSVAKDFAIESGRSLSDVRFCLMKNGLQITDWMTRPDMKDLLQDAAHAAGRAAIEQILKT